MEQITIYHNPRCSKSREALQLLQSHHLNPVIVEYLKTPLTWKELIELKSHFPLEDFVRTKEPVFKEFKLSLNDETKVLQAMMHSPILMQRPIVTFKNKAIIARPVEKILELLSN